MTIFFLPYKISLFCFSGNVELHCPWCKVTCTSIDNFINHQKVHKKSNGNFQFFCTVCSYSTTKVSDVKRHLMRHYGLKPFKCQICDYSSVCKGDVKVHFQSHMSKRKK